VPCKRNNGVDAAEAPQSLIHNTSGGAGIKQIGCKRLRERTSSRAPCAANSRNVAPPTFPVAPARITTSSCNSTGLLLKKL
jgi:hypothetical protein